MDRLDARQGYKKLSKLPLMVISGNNKSKGDNVADVLIIGGGLVGMTLGCALGAAGIAVALVEPTRPSRLVTEGFDGRTTAIAAGSKVILDTIDIWSDIANEAQPILDIRVSDGHSPLFLHYDRRDVGVDALGYIVENRVIRSALLKGLTNAPSVKLLSGCRVDRLDITNSFATAHLDNSDILRTRLAVATDGRNSPTRRAAGIDAISWRYNQTGIVCTVAHEEDHAGVAQERFMPAGPFAILPMIGRRSSVVWTERSDLAPALLALDEDAFLTELSSRVGPYLGARRVISSRFSHPIGLMHARNYIADRVALAGDAAHAIHPIAGQGLNIGWRDVAVLAEVIVDALRLGVDPGSITTLNRYEQWRRVDNTLMLAATDTLNRLFSNNVGPVRLVRDVGLALVNRAPPLKKLFIKHAMGVLGDVPRLVRGDAL